MFFAAAPLVSPNQAFILLVLIGGLYWAYQSFFAHPKAIAEAEAKQPDTTGDEILEVAFQARSVGLDALAAIFKAMASNNRDQLIDEVWYLYRQIQGGKSFGDVLKGFIVQQIQSWLDDPLKREELLSIIKAKLGVTITPATTTALPSATTSAP